MKIRFQSGHFANGCASPKEAVAAKQIINRYQQGLANGHRFLTVFYGLVLLLAGMLSGVQAQTLPCGYRTLTTNNFSNAGVVPTRTGGNGIATVAGNVANTGNVVDTDLTNFAAINTVLGVGSGGRISVNINQGGGSAVIGAGATVGYVVGSNSTLAANLLGSTTISTYLNGTLQESSSASTLLNLAALSGTGQTTLGFVTTKNFDEVQISIATLVSAVTTTQVFYPFVQYANLTLTATATNASGPAVADGVVSASVTGGRPPYGSYTYTGPNTSTTTSSTQLTGRAPGSYTVTVTDANGCTATATATVGSPTPFACTPNVAYLVSSATNSSTARQINLTTGAVTATYPAIAGNLIVNPLGFNPTDNYLWGAFRSTPNRLVRFDANFTPTSYTVTIPSGVNSGDISRNGIFYLYNGNTSATTIQRVDLSSGTPVALSNLTLTSGINIADFTFNPIDNNLYALTNGKILYRILIPASTSATSATLVNLGTATLSPDPGGYFFGAAYTDSNGNFYALDNNSGRTYRINTVNALTGSQVVSATSISTNTDLIASETDGARCPSSQVAPEAKFAFNCATVTVAGSFTAGGSTSQPGTLTIPITSATAGIASFSVAITAAGFTTNPAPYNTTLTAGQTSVTVPILYDGSGTPGPRTLSFDSEQATNNGCSVTVTITGQPDLTTSINQVANQPVANQASALPIQINNIGNIATTGATTSVINIPANVTVPATFTSNGFSCSTSGTVVSCSTSATLAAGASTSLTVPFTPTVASIGTFLSFTNTVATSGESNTNNNRATITLTLPVAGQPDLTTSIGQPVPALVAGQTSSLPISVSNIGTAVTSGPLTQTIAIPASVTAPATFTSNGFSCSTSGSVVSCSSSATLAAGTSTTFAVPITPLAAGAGTSQVFSTTVATDNESNVNNNTATLTIGISASITASPDAGTASAGTGGTAVANVAANDAVNGVPATLGATGNATVAMVGTYPVGITLNTTTGSVSVAVGTTPGSYTLVYQVCDKLTTPTCATTTATITVTSSITASPDAGTALASGGTAVINVRANDLVNGQTATTANSSLSLVSSQNSGITLNTMTGSVSVAQGTAPGTYTLTYQLCSTLGSTTCTTSYASITVTPSITTSPDAGTARASGGTAITNVTTNDVVNGVTPILSGSAANATLTTVGTSAPGITLNTTTGSVSVASGTAPGTYTLVYQLCTIATPVVCATTTATVTVQGPDLTIAIGQPVPGLLVGQTSSVPVSVNNIGTVPTQGPVSFTLSIPASVTAPAAFTSNGFTCTTSGTLVSCSSSATITNGASTTIQVPITPLVASAGTSPTLSATVATANESNINNNTASTTTGPVLAPDLTIAIGQPSPVLTIGVASSVPVIISNIGTSPTAGPVSFTLSIPASTTAPATFSSNGFGCVTSGTLVSCSSSATIVNSNNVTVSIPVTATTISTTPVFSATVITANESNPNNNTATTTASAVVAPDLTVTINQPSPVLVAGQTSAVPVTISNIGTITTLGPVSFTLSIPATLTAAASFTSNGFTCTTSGTLVSCSSSATITSGTSTTLAIPVTPLNAAVGTSPVLSGTVATLGESNTSNNTATITVNTPVAGQPDLIVAIGQPSPNLVVGQTSSVPVSLSNTGTAPTSGPVNFTLSIPANVTASAMFTSNGFTCATSGTLVSCSSPTSISNAASTTVLVPITPLPGATGTSPALSATVATGNESNPNNNTTTTTVTTPVVAPDLIIAIGQPGPALVVGQTSSVPISLSNIGTAPTSGLVSFTLSIPASVTAPAAFTSNGFTCTTSGTLVSCSSSATITNGASTTIQVPVTPLTAAASTSQTLSATVATANESNVNNNTATTSLAISASVTAGPDSGTASAGTGGIAVTDVRTNDLVNGVTSTSANSTLTLVNSQNPGITLNPSTGSVSVAVGTTPGSYTLTYQLCDNLTPATCTTALVMVTVTPSVIAVPDAGTANTGTGTIAVADVRANDLVNGVTSTSANSSLSLVSSQNPGLTLNTTTGSVSVAQGTAPGTYTLTYQLCSTLGSTTCTTSYASVTVTGDSPIATPDIANTQLNTPVSGNLLTNDTDPQGLPLTTSLLTPPAAGTAVVNPDGTYTYTPPANFTGTVSFCYRVSNTAGLSSSACVSVNVVPDLMLGNNAPVASDDNTRTIQNTPVSIAVLANDTDPDSATSLNGQLSNPVILSPPAQGTATVNANGTISYTPPANFTGIITFPYQVCDQATPALCATATVSVNVLPTPPAGTTLAPVTVDDALLTKVNTPKAGNVSTNDSDLQGLTLTYTASQPTSGTVVMSPTGSYTYTPAPGFTGPDRFTYSVCNSAGNCAQATTTILVQALAPQVSLQPQVYLQGALFGVTSPDVLMRDELRTKGLIPLSHPYAYLTPITPTAPMDPSVTAVTGSDAIVDWVFVELRSAANSATITDSRAALLQRDGDIVGVDGVSPVIFSQALPGSYYVAVRHRNHLGVMSLNPLALSATTTTVDFRNQNTPAFTYTGTTSYTQTTPDQAQVVVQQGVAMWAGNTFLDNAGSSPHNFVIFQGTSNDVQAIYNQVIANPLSSPIVRQRGYLMGDVNLNGETIYQGSGNDVEFIYQNVINNHPGNGLKLPFFSIREQLP